MSDSRLSVDWLQGTCPEDKLPELRKYLSWLCGGRDPEDLEYGQYRYELQSVWSEYGVRLFYDRHRGRRNEDGTLVHGGRCCVVFPGSALARLGADEVYQLFRDLLSRFCFLGTRVDLAFDDMTRSITPSQVAVYADQGKYGGFRRHEHICGKRRNGVMTGDTLYFGTRGKSGGGRFMRCYDKALESGGEIDSVRWELECSKDKAQQVVFKLWDTANVEDFTALIGAYIGGAIDFIERKTVHKLRNAERLEWWAALVARIGAARLENQRRVLTVESVRSWVKRSVYPSLHMLRAALGEDVFRQMMQEAGQCELRGRQVAAIEDYRLRNVPDRERREWASEFAGVAA